MDNTLGQISSALGARAYKQESCPNGRKIYGLVSQGEDQTLPGTLTYLPPGTLQFEPRGLLDRLHKPTVFVVPEGTVYVQRGLPLVTPPEAGIYVVTPSWYTYGTSDFLQKVDDLCGKAKPPGAVSDARHRFQL